MGDPKYPRKVWRKPKRPLNNQQNWRFRGIYPNDWIFKIHNETLWGATAKMTRELLGLA